MTKLDQTAVWDSISALVPAGEEPGEVLKATLDALPDPLLIFDTESRIVFANSAAARYLSDRAVPLTGEPGDLCNGLRIFDSTTQNPVTRDRLPVTRALHGETVDSVEYAVRTLRPGTPFWIECAARPLRGASGKIGASGEIRGAVFTFRDITARKNREIELESAEQLRQFIYKENLAGVLHTTVDGRILDCNEAILRIFGYSSKEELQTVRSPQLYADPEERERLLRLTKTSPDAREFEICFRRRDNSRGWALISMRMLDPRPGHVGGTLVSTVVDITDRKLSEETLRRSQETFAAFMSNLPGVAFIKDLKGNYIYFNEASWTQFRKHPAEIIGKTDDDIWPAEDAARKHATDRRVIESARPIEFVEPVVQSDGVHSWLVFKFPILEDGRPAFIGGIGIDITERRILEDQLTQARKMEALGRLAGGVAHDFNNLLTVIAGYGQLTLEGLESTPIPRLTIYLQEILNSARRASGLTSQLLAFSRRQTVEPKVMDLCDLLRSIEVLLQRMIGEHVELEVHCSPEPCLIRADAHQIEQVLMNLAVNARDAMPLGGTLEIRCERLAEPLQRPDLRPLDILLEVRDTGVGMDESVKARIFEPFFTSKEKGKGTGLGLSTVYGVVSQADGEIDVESEPGQGSRFRIYLPSVAAESAGASAVAGHATPAGRETVLLVEDEASVRSLTETVLKRLGYNVLVADSGQAALDIWDRKRDSIDILLTDVIMPQMSGSELADRLREMKPHLKVLFMSGYTDDMLENQGVLARETQLIQKPFSADALGSKLRAVLEA